MKKYLDFCLKYEKSIGYIYYIWFQLAIIVVFVLVFVFEFAFYKANLHKSAHLHGETDRETLNIHFLDAS